MSCVSDLRKLYIVKYYIHRPSMFKLIELLNTDRKKQLHNLSIFIFKACEKRNSITYIRDVNI